MRKILPFLVSLLLLVLGMQLGFAAGRSYYRDVPTNKWYSDAVFELTDLGLFDGYSDGTFRPGNAVNRAELAVVLQQLIRLMNDSGVEISGISNLSNNSSSNNSTTLPSGYNGFYSGSNGTSSSSSSNLPVLPPSTAISSGTYTPSGTFNENYRIALTNNINFIVNKLSTSGGAIYSNLSTNNSSSSVVGVNHEVLSESYGLVFNALAVANEPSLFSRYYNFFTQRILSDQNLAYWKLNENLTPYENAMATIDDMKIIKGLLRGYEKFGETRYRDTALAMAAVIKNYGLRNGALVNHISWNSSGNKYAASHIVLGYPDLQVTRMLATYDSAWNAIHTATVNIVKGGQLSNGLFNYKYNFDTSRYENEGTLQMIFQAYAAENLALAGETSAAQRFINFVKNEFNTKGKIYARYNTDGTAAVGYQDLAVYSIIARTALALNETTFASQLMGKILRLQIINTAANVFGAFLWSEDENVYSFSQINALFSVAMFSRSGINPTTPPVETGSSSGSSSSSSSGVTGSSTPDTSRVGITYPPAVTGTIPSLQSNQFAIWQASDIHVDDDNYNENLWVEAIRDMNNIPWTKAILAGDLTDNGERNQLTKLIAALTNSNHPRTDFNTVAGNHEHNCNTANLSSGHDCIDNYSDIVTPDLHYSWNYGNVHFVMVSVDCTSYMPCDATFDWMRSDIAANQDKIVVVVTHHNPNLWPKYMDILRDYNVDLALFGHDHCQHGDTNCNRHDALGDLYQQNETTFVNAGYIGNKEYRYIIFTEGSNAITIRSRNFETHAFQDEYARAVTTRFAFRR